MDVICKFIDKSFYPLIFDSIGFYLIILFTVF
jgi:hypothetical protein